MDVHFYGTAAFEGIPSLFCRCTLCGEARKRGGKNIRSRTSVSIDNELKIDFPPDSFYHMIRDGIDLEEMKDLLFTHSHSDHLYTDDLNARLPGYAQAAERPIHVYAHDVVLRLCQQAMEAPQDKFRFHRIQPFHPVQTQTAMITPLLASHDPMETCLLYYIEKDGRQILHGHDSGWFPEPTWAFLKDKQLDLAILECTVGRSPHRANHMNIDAVLETKAWFDENRVLQPTGKVVVTHFSHNAHLLHEDLAAIFEPDIIVAYDGMTLQI
ncbi:MBL fold metallo-hydrolase [Alicyclobacillus fodiniaquatilis]|uniref:MBL fold metallo-hydrolase n=1 Tax=Alicyclobacillus fodiniaquatilis TaxID=1661150 RepID=A0ABW4JAX1_9BACL